MDQDTDEPKKKRARVVKTVRPSVLSQFCGIDSTTVKKARIVWICCGSFIFLHKSSLLNSFSLYSTKFFGVISCFVYELIFSLLTWHVTDTDNKAFY